MGKIETEIQFGTSFVTTKEQEDLSYDLVRYNKQKAASEFGIRVAEAKGWMKQEYEKFNSYHMVLFVFTREELEEYIKAKIDGRFA